MKKYLLIILCLSSMNLVVGQQQASLLGTWNDSTLVGSFAYNNAYNEVWGITVNGMEFGVIGSTEGTHFIDLSNPMNPHEVAFVEGAYTGAGVIHRDFHDYQNHLYIVCDEGTNSTLQIVDFSNLPTSVSTVYDESTLITRSHNIFIDESAALLYTCGGNQNGKVFDISSPANPVFVGRWNDFYIHDAYVKNNIAYFNCGTHGLVIVDFSDPANPVEIGSLTSYPFKGYNHSGWLTPDGSTYYLADEDHGYDIKVCNVSDPTDIQVTNTFNAQSSEASSIVHNLIVKDNLLFASYYYDGLQVYDISDPNNPIRIAHYDTYLGMNNSSYEGAWGVYPFLASGLVLVSDMQTGLYVFDNPSSLVATEDFPEYTDQWKVFPQPFNNTFQFEIESVTNTGLKFDILGLDGQLVKQFGERMISEGKQVLKFDTSELAAGVYLLQISGKSDRQLVKLVKY